MHWITEKVNYTIIIIIIYLFFLTKRDVLAMYLSSSTKYFVMYLGTSTSTFFKLKYKVQANTRKNVLKYRYVQVPMYLAPTLVNRSIYFCPNFTGETCLSRTVSHMGIRMSPYFPWLPHWFPCVNLSFSLDQIFFSRTCSLVCIRHISSGLGWKKMRQGYQMQVSQTTSCGSNEL